MGRLLRHIFLPRHTNNHRAKALHVDALLFYVLIFAIFNFFIRFIHWEYPQVLGYATDIRVEELLNLTNQKRESMGLNSLKLNSTLSRAAAKKAADMFANDYWAHTSPSGKTPWDFISGSGYTYTLAGENLAKNFSTSQGVVDAWMASPTHRENIVKEGYRDIGFAIVNGVLVGEETTLVVQMFGTTSEPIATLEEEQKAPQPIAVGNNLGVDIAANVQSSPVTFIEKLYKLPKKSMIKSVSSVTSQPLFNIPSLSRDIVFLFLGLLIGILILDGLVVYKKHTVRVTGHTVAHILFLTAVTITISIIQRGALL